MLSDLRFDASVYPKLTVIKKMIKNKKVISTISKYKNTKIIKENLTAFDRIKCNFVFVKVISGQHFTE